MTARDTDAVARLGGDEFVVVLPDTGWQGALTFAERLRRRVDEHTFGPAKASMRVTISVGVALARGSDRDVDGNIAPGSGPALYKAKTAGRNRVSSLTARMPIGDARATSRRPRVARARRRTHAAAAVRRAVRADRRADLDQARDAAARRRVQVPRRVQLSRAAAIRPSARAASSRHRRAITRRPWRSRPSCSASRRRSSCRRP